MNALRQTNTFSKGMNMDLDYSVISSDQYQYAENIRIVSNENCSSAVMQNIEGFFKTSLSQNFQNETIIHVDTIRDWAVVFTKKNSGGNNIYRLDFTEPKELTPVLTLVASVDLEIPSDAKISSVCRWESDNNVKVYWCDGVHSLRVLNVAEEYSDITSDDLDILPKSTLPPLTFKGNGSGSLKAGKYQYCYQLFNSRGSETSLSVISQMFMITKDSSNNSQDITGSEKEENTGKSIIIGTVLPSSSFNRARIISLYYGSTTDLPIITVVDDISISGNILYYEDKGGSVVNEITLDEFNALTTYEFIPKVIESKDNVLFAANITEDTWDIDDSYDARVFRFDSDGVAKLLSNSGQNTITLSFEEVENYTENRVPSDHDCINPFNLDDNAEYKYTRTSTGNYVLGGKGKNIEYRFIISSLIEDSTRANVSGNLVEDFSLNSKAYSSNSLPLYYIDSSGNKEIAGDIPFTEGSIRVINYSNPEVELMVKGYQRDEIYRFGIVFYNESNTPSSVHWIGDIKMPSMNDLGYETFNTNESVELGLTKTTNQQLVTHPLGIQFIVKNVPKDVTGYEIVRCDRTVADRSILMQGVVSDVCNYDRNDSTLLPLPYLAYATSYGLVTANKDKRYAWQFSTYASNEYFMFVSPEICVNRENIDEELNRVTSIKGLKTLISEFDSTVGPEEGIPDNEDLDLNIYGGKTKIFANAKQVKINGETINDVDTLNYGKYNGWSYENASIKDSSDHSAHADNAVMFGADGYYSTGLAKYYKKIPSSDTPTMGEATINDITYAIEIDPFDTENNINNSKWKTKGTAIGNMSYYNFVFDALDVSIETNANNVRKMGPHGLCAIFQSNDMSSNIGRAGSKTGICPQGYANSVPLCNLKQSVTPYGGITYSARQNSTYITTGCYQLLDGSDSYKNNCFGGDTYIGVLDYAVTSFGFYVDDYELNKPNRIYVGSYIPVESSINLSLRTDDVQTSKTYTASGYSNHFVQNDICQIGDIYTQNVPLYAYNDAYSSRPNGKEFVSKSIYSIDNLNSDTRVLNSLTKTNNEVSDSWTKFKVSNYIDLDTRFGSVNNMMIFDNKLFFWQTDAFGVLSVNERSLITDNNIGTLTLGTSGILARYDYITTKNGSKQNQLRTATCSDGSIYWYDADRNEICGYNGSLNTVSKLKGVQSYLNNNKETITQDPVTTYDKKYNEVLFTLDDKTLVFNEQIGAFTSFYTFKPDWYVEFADKLYTFNSLNLYKYNFSDTSDLYNDEDKVSYVRFIVNGNYTQTKTFDNVEYGGDFTYGTNFNEIYFQTKRQTSYTTTDKQIDYREDTYKFCIPRNNIELNEAEQLVNKSYKDRMKGKYLICNYKYDCNGGNTFKVPYISTAYRYSMI